MKPVDPADPAGRELLALLPALEGKPAAPCSPVPAVAAPAVPWLPVAHAGDAVDPGWAQAFTCWQPQRVGGWTGGRVAMRVTPLSNSTHTGDRVTLSSNLS
jgi:hypothetical protein